MSEFTKTDIEDIKTSIQTINGQTLKNTNAKLDYLDKFYIVNPKGSMVDLIEWLKK